MSTMKLFLLFVLIVGISADQSVGSDEYKLGGFPSLGGSISDIISGIIKKLLDSVRAVVPEPISIAKLNISLPYENLANGSFILTDLIEIGAKNFNASSVSVNMMKSALTVIVDIPSININTNYFSDLLFGSILPMYGEGPANIRLKNLRLNFTSKYSLNILKLQMQVKNTSIIMNLGDAVFDLHGMINNEAFSILCSQILDDTVDVFINKHNVLISNIISPIVETVINSVLSKKQTTAAFLYNAPIELEEFEVMELRNMFFNELMKQPMVSKYVSL
ncbi:uncharacterized protein LOC123678244 [Harmonia axyridis]|uniref:uncharacterized protein LOC123678244 n=1 Tax=Harmonia axyridis TaxID=115357 RepID=UPI001E278C75|nr:uncharacterized protein LOC123678244 [Harmonia axyridis]